jgi:hypothetical protein
MKKNLLLLLAPFLFACSNYGSKATVDNIEVYYKEGISKEQAEKTARLFDEMLNASNPDDKAQKSFQLQKAGDTILLKMVADKAKLSTVSDDAFYAITTVVSDSVFAGAVVNLTLTDNTFKGFKEYAYRKVQANSWGEKYASGLVEVYDDGVGSIPAKELAAYMTEYFVPQTTFSFQLTRDEQQQYLVRMVVNPEKMSFFTAKIMAEISEGISSKVLQGAPVQFQLTDNKFNPLRTFAYPADASGLN